MKQPSKKFWFNPNTLETRDSKPKNTNNWEHWDSKAEFNLYYQVLLPLCKVNDLKCHKHYRLKIATSPNFGHLFWNTDFLITQNDQIVAIVEYKGDWVLHNQSHLKSLKLTLALLEINNNSLFYRIGFVGSCTLRKRLKNINTFLPSETNKLTDWLTYVISGEF